MEAKKITCTCGRHNVTLGRNGFIFGFKQHCMIEAVYKYSEDSFQEIERLKMEINELEKYKNALHKLKKRINRMLCFICDEPVGKNYDFFGDSVCCHSCTYNLGLVTVGGEG